MASGNFGVYSGNNGSLGINPEYLSPQVQDHLTRILREESGLEDRAVHLRDDPVYENEAFGINPLPTKDPSFQVVSYSPRDGSAEIKVGDRQVLVYRSGDRVFAWCKGNTEYLGDVANHGFHEVKKGLRRLIDRLTHSH